jgi:hypothetical protein
VLEATKKANDSQKDIMATLPNKKRLTPLSIMVTIEWFDSELPMRDPTCLDNNEYLAMAESLEVHREEEQLFGRDWYDPDCFATAILGAKYEKVNVDDVVKQLTHLSKSQ